MYAVLEYLSQYLPSIEGQLHVKVKWNWSVPTQAASRSPARLSRHS
jgi:hypothetical protein